MMTNPAMRRRRVTLGLTLAGVCTIAPFVWSRSPPRLSARSLGDVATIDVPTGLDASRYLGDDDETQHRTSFQFESTFLWASMSGKMHYRQLVVVSVLSPEAPDGAWRQAPRRHAHLLEDVRVVHDAPLGPGRLVTTQGAYPVVADRLPAYHHLYAEPGRRLQIHWHAVRSECDPAASVATLQRMAASFRPRAGTSAESGRRPRVVVGVSGRSLARAGAERGGAWEYRA